MKTMKITKPVFFKRSYCQLALTFQTRDRVIKLKAPYLVKQ
jgi:hypothetical protein